MKERIVILTGPTGIGKTELSIKLAKDLNSEIISADSMQIYKYMDIGTAKATISQRKAIHHNLIDIVSPDKEFTVSDYMRKSTRIISDLNNKNIIPLVVGGTGLYLNSLIYDLNFTSVARDQNIRDKYENLADFQGNEYIHDILKKVDFNSYEKININDRKRIIRALEIYELTGKTMSENNKNFRKPNDKYDIVLIILNMDRSKLYERINHRVDKMISLGLISEVENLLSRGFGKELQSMQAIGYKEIIMYINNVISLDEAIAKIKQGSRNYAKRQLTWFRRYDNANWINIDNYNNIEDLSNFVLTKVKAH